MTTFDYETIIVGAGAAGMNCALDLQKAGRDYLLVADYMGGRIFNDTSMHMNYGAVASDAGQVAAKAASDHKPALIAAAAAAVAACAAILLRRARPGCAGFPTNDWRGSGR